jgi:hypothetical protein
MYWFLGSLLVYSVFFAIYMAYVGEWEPMGTSLIVAVGITGVIIYQLRKGSKDDSTGI